MVLFSIVFLALKEVVIFTLGLFCSSWIILSYSTTKTEFEYLLRPYSLHFGGHAHFSPEHSWLVLNRSIRYGDSFKKKNQNKCDSWLILKQIPKNMSESVLRPLLVSVSESVSGQKTLPKKFFTPFQMDDIKKHQSLNDCWLGVGSNWWDLCIIVVKRHQNLLRNLFRYLFQNIFQNLFWDLFRYLFQNLSAVTILNFCAKCRICWMRHATSQ